MPDQDLKTRKPPEIIKDTEDSALEEYQGQWGIAFVGTNGRHHIDVDEAYGSEAEAAARIDIAVEWIKAGTSCHVRTKNGIKTFINENFSYAYPIPLGGE